MLFSVDSIVLLHFLMTLAGVPLNIAVHRGEPGDGDKQLLLCSTKCDWSIYMQYI